MLSRAADAQSAQRAFLPAALEILETPVSPVGRAVAATIAAFTVIAVIWASIGTVDIIATAQGKVVPTGRTKVVQPLETGIVTAIKVQNGDRVAAGQVLIELDRTVSTAERNRVDYDLRRTHLDVARLTALRAGIEARSAPKGFTPPSDAAPEEVARTRATLEAQASEQAAKIAALDRQIAQKAAEASEVAAQIAKLEASLPLTEETAEVRRKAMNIQYGNRIAHLEAQQRLIEQRHELQVQQRRAVGVAEARQALEQQRDQAAAEFAHKVLADLTDAEVKAKQLSEDAIKAAAKIDEQVLRAPIEGTVQQLAIYTIGGVVTPAQQLMAIVPADSHVEVEAMVPNKDIGFVRPGQTAEVKIDTFNFTRYGLLRGQVTAVSQDAIVREKAGDRSAPARTAAALADTSEPQGQELVYAARVSLDHTQMQVDDRLVNLAPGMAVSVEIRTGSRRIIEYLLSPLLRYKQESLRER